MALMYKRNGLKVNYTWKDIIELVKQDFSVIIATYAIVAAYCFVCSRSIKDVEENVRCMSIIQLWVDSIVPTTITLVLTSILQSFFSEKGHKKNFFHFMSLVGIIVFTMVTSGFHPINEGKELLAVIIGSVILMIVNLGLIIEEKTVSDVTIGISGRKD